MRVSPVWHYEQVQCVPWSASRCDLLYARDNNCRRDTSSCPGGPARPSVQPFSKQALLRAAHALHCKTVGRAVEISGGYYVVAARTCSPQPRSTRLLLLCLPISPPLRPRAAVVPPLPPLCPPLRPRAAVVPARMQATASRLPPPDALRHDRPGAPKAQSSRSPLPARPSERGRVSHATACPCKTAIHPRACRRRRGR